MFSVIFLLAEKKSSKVKKSASSLKNIEASRTPVSSMPKVQTGNAGLRIGLKSTNVSGGTKSPGMPLYNSMILLNFFLRLYKPLSVLQEWKCCAALLGSPIAILYV